MNENSREPQVRPTGLGNPSVPGRRVVYSFVVADLFHYGHLQLLQTAKSLGDYHICGVLTDEAAQSYRPSPISNFEERIAVISNIKCVDRVMVQKDKDPTHVLKQIHREFPDLELILVHGNDWKAMPGRRYVESIGGRVIQPEYYRRLSDSRIKDEINKQHEQGTGHFEFFTEHFRLGDIIVYDGAAKPFVISTKANTLRSLQPILKKSRVEQIYAFRVCDWEENQKEIIQQIESKFSKLELVVRSSAINEDTYFSSQAGAYTSLTGVPAANGTKIQEAIEKVIRSYREKGNFNPANQILVQPQLKDIRFSGVAFTCHPRTGSPYYIVNYDDETSSTSSVTGGVGGALIEILHGTPMERIPPKWRSLLSAIQELESIIPCVPLDIEFGITHRSRVVIFQVRPMVLAPGVTVPERTIFSRHLKKMKIQFKKYSRPKSHLAGANTALSDMAFWNPAEMIGDKPPSLPISLYRYLITDSVWHKALLEFGYQPVNPTALLVEIGGKPYVDLRIAFNALLPQGLKRSLRERLVTYYLEKLRQSPELHDKVEFEIVDNCYHFASAQRARKLRDEGFGKADCDDLMERLKVLTESVIRHSPQIFRKAELSCLRMARKRVSILAQLTAAGPKRCHLGAAWQLLKDCRQYGTFPFSQVARMTFVARALLESLEREYGECGGVMDHFAARIHTVMQDLNDDLGQVSSGRMRLEEFLSRYGHLRPGTYDIASPRYDAMEFNMIAPAERESNHSTARDAGWSMIESRLENALKKVFPAVSCAQFLQFAKLAMENREKVKFEFTKNLSEALRLIAETGEGLGFSREALRHLDVRTIQKSSRSDDAELTPLWERTIQRNLSEWQINSRLSMPSLIFTDSDMEFIVHRQAKPNFVTRKKVAGSVEVLDTPGNGRNPELQGKIVALEKADPGFDWLFMESIAGLVTKYGGVASHMAIRCGELGLPAAIGCGSLIYDMVQSAKTVMLDCELGQIRKVS